MKLLAGTILKSLLAGAFKGTPNICDLWVSSQYSILLKNPTPEDNQYARAESVRGFVWLSLIHAWKGYYLAPESQFGEFYSPANVCS